MITAFGWWHIPDAVALEQQLFDIQPWTPAQFWAELAADDRVLVAEVEDGALRGYAALAVGGDEAEVLNIAVAPAWQGHGLGRRLLQALFDAVRHAGGQRVLLEVRPDNQPALALYERSGFRRIGLRRDYYALGVDAVLMECHV